MIIWVNFLFLSDIFTLFDTARKRPRYSIRNSGGIRGSCKNQLLQDKCISRICGYFKDCVVFYLYCDTFLTINDIIHVITYVSPEGSKIYDHSEEKNVFLVGDFNAVQRISQIISQMTVSTIVIMSIQTLSIFVIIKILTGIIHSGNLLLIYVTFMIF